MYDFISYNYQFITIDLFEMSTNIIDNCVSDFLSKKVDISISIVKEMNDFDLERKIIINAMSKMFCNHILREIMATLITHKKNDENFLEINLCCKFKVYFDFVKNKEYYSSNRKFLKMFINNNSKFIYDMYDVDIIIKKSTKLLKNVIDNHKNLSIKNIYNGVTNQPFISFKLFVNK